MNSVFPEPPLARQSADLNWFLEPFKSIMDRNSFFKNQNQNFSMQADTELIKKQSRKSANSYQRHYKTYVDIMERVDPNDKEIEEFILNKFSEMSVGVLKMMQAKQGDSQPKGLMSFPPVEKHSSRKRLAPPSSPKR